MNNEIVIMLIALFRSMFSEEHQVQQHIADLLDDDLDVAEEAAESLGDLAHPMAVPALIAALEMMHLEMLQTKDADVQARLIDLQQDIVRALGKIGDARAVESLIGVMHSDTDRGIRYEAVTSLRKIGTPAALAAIQVDDE